MQCSRLLFLSVHGPKISPTWERTAQIYLPLFASLNKTAKQISENRNSVQISPLCPPLYNRHTRLQNKYMFNWQLTTAGALFGVIIWDRKDITRWEMRMLCWHLICSQSEEFEQMMREPLTIKLFWSPRAHFRCEICSSSFLSPFPAPVSSLDQARPVQSWGIEGRVVLSLFSPPLVEMYFVVFFEKYFWKSWGKGRFITVLSFTCPPAGSTRHCPSKVHKLVFFVVHFFTSEKWILFHVFFLDIKPHFIGEVLKVFWSKISPRQSIFVQIRTSISIVLVNSSNQYKESPIVHTSVGALAYIWVDTVCWKCLCWIPPTPAPGHLVRL